MSREFYRMPDGSFVRNAKVYCEAWRALARPVEVALGARLFGWDPGFTFVSLADGSHIHISTRTAEAIRARSSLKSKPRRRSRSGSARP